MDKSKYIRTILNDIEKSFEELDDNNPDEETLLFKITEVNTKLLSILEYMANHLCDNFIDLKSRSKIEFPILPFESIESDKTLSDLEDKIKHFGKISPEIKQVLNDFFIKAYEIIKKPEYDLALLYLNKSIKHRIIDDIEDGKLDYDLDYTSFNNELSINKTIRGGLDIGNFVHDSRSTFDGCVFIDENGPLIINKATPKISPGKTLLVTDKEGKSHKLIINDFLEKSIECCKEIFELWQKLVSK